MKVENWWLPFDAWMSCVCILNKISLEKPISIPMDINVSNAMSKCGIHIEREICFVIIAVDFDTFLYIFYLIHFILCKYISIRENIRFFTLKSNPIKFYAVPNWSGKNQMSFVIKKLGLFRIEMFLGRMVRECWRQSGEKRNNEEIKAVSYCLEGKGHNSHAYRKIRHAKFQSFAVNLLKLWKVHDQSHLISTFTAEGDCDIILSSPYKWWA